MKGLLTFICLISIATPGSADKVSELRDPTRPDAVGTNSSKLITGKTRRARGKPLFSLQQTLVSPERKGAMINGKLVGIGDEIDGATVISISRDKAFVQWGREVIELKLFSGNGIKEANR